MIRDITVAIGIDFCGFFTSSPANKVEHNDTVTHLTFIQTADFGVYRVSQEEWTEFWESVP